LTLLSLSVVCRLSSVVYGLWCGVVLCGVCSKKPLGGEKDGPGGGGKKDGDRDRSDRDVEKLARKRTKSKVVNPLEELKKEQVPNPLYYVAPIYLPLPQP